jgi:N-acetylglutamate synthase-like GNAT family acetyltransferase
MPISKATIKDITELTNLVNSAYRGETSKKGWTSESHLLDGIRIDEEAMGEYLQGANVTILKYIDDEEQIIGCVYLELKKQKLYLGMLTVSPLLQTNGIGRQLLHEAERIANRLNCSAIFMTVITTRHELIQWYERRGYCATGEILPFHEGTRFGTPNQLIELGVFEKEV